MTQVHVSPELYKTAPKFSLDLFRCRKCEAILDSYTSLRTHLKQCQAEMKTHSPKRSRSPVFRSINLTYEYVYQRNSGIYCDSCKCTFLDHDSLDKHARLCSGETPFSSLTCSSEEQPQKQRKKPGPKPKKRNGAKKSKRTSNPISEVPVVSRASPVGSNGAIATRTTHEKPVSQESKLARKSLNLARERMKNQGVKHSNMRKIKPSKEADDPIRVPDLSDEMTCPICGFLSKRSHINMHIIKKHDKKHICADCLYCGESLDDLEKHVKACHEEANLKITTHEVCKFCSIKIKSYSKGNIRRHVQNIHGVVLPHEEAVVRVQSVLSAASNSNTSSGEKGDSVSCRFCKVKFKRNDSLWSTMNRHMKLSHLGVSKNCFKCSQPFNKFIDLIIHEDTC